MRNPYDDLPTNVLGRAIRLVFELGLHRDASKLESTNMLQMNLEVRQVVFWGCFTFNRYANDEFTVWITRADCTVRMWALYLGRPYSIKLDDVTVLRPGCNAEALS